MKVLTRYIGREVLAAVLFIFAGLVSLFAFFDLIHELGDVGRGGYTLGSAALYVALQLPARMYELFPVAALIGTLFAMAQLVANSEYTVMRASGASLLQVSWALVRIGIPLAVATFLAGEYVAPPAERLAQHLRMQARGDAPRVVAQAFRSGFWFKQDRTFVNIRGVLSDMTLVGVRIYEFDDTMHLRALRTAETGKFGDDGHWRLVNVRTTELGEDATRVTTAASQPWQTILRPSLLTVYQIAPERLELDTLWDNMRILGGNSQKTTRFEIAFWNKVFYPAGVVVMMILALPFAYIQRRSGGRGFAHLRGDDAGACVFPARDACSPTSGCSTTGRRFSRPFSRSSCSSGVATTMLWWLERR